MKRNNTWGILLIVALTVLTISPYFLSQVGTAMAAPESSKTLENLQKAYDVEKYAQEAYLAYADKAQKEGYSQVASLFKAAAASEAVHIGNYTKLMAKMKSNPKPTARKPVIKSTKENLAAAIKMENEIMGKYPDFIKQAQADKNKHAAMSMKGTQEGAQFHVNYFNEAMNNLNAWKVGTKQFIVCTTCGYMTTDLTLKKCPICSVPRNKFLDVQ
jgi:rubrerythrin